MPVDNTPVAKMAADKMTLDKSIVNRMTVEKTDMQPQKSLSLIFEEKCGFTLS